MDPLNLDMQVALIGGAILASPFILYQVWLFIAPGLYQKERRFVVPFMAATVGPVPRRRGLWLLLCPARRYADFDRGFWEELHPHGHH